MSSLLHPVRSQSGRNDLMPDGVAHEVAEGTELELTGRGKSLLMKRRPLLCENRRTAAIQ